MVGENSTLPVKFIFKDKVVSEISVNLSEEKRSKMDVAFNEPVRNLALEANITLLETEE